MNLVLFCLRFGSFLNQSRQSADFWGQEKGDTNLGPRLTLDFGLTLASLWLTSTCLAVEVSRLSARNLAAKQSDQMTQMEATLIKLLPEANLCSAGQSDTLRWPVNRPFVCPIGRRSHQLGPNKDQVSHTACWTQDKATVKSRASIKQPVASIEQSV